MGGWESIKSQERARELALSDWGCSPRAIRGGVRPQDASEEGCRHRSSAREWQQAGEEGDTELWGGGEAGGAR
eukprot:45410-Pleurochrysis_carterae.AAC.1